MGRVTISARGFKRGVVVDERERPNGVGADGRAALFFLERDMRTFAREHDRLSEQERVRRKIDVRKRGRRLGVDPFPHMVNLLLVLNPDDVPDPLWAPRLTAAERAGLLALEALAQDPSGETSRRVRARVRRERAVRGRAPVRAQRARVLLLVASRRARTRESSSPPSASSRSNGHTGRDPPQCRAGDGAGDEDDEDDADALVAARAATPRPHAVDVGGVGDVVGGGVGAPRGAGARRQVAP